MLSLSCARGLLWFAPRACAEKELQLPEQGARVLDFSVESREGLPTTHWLWNTQRNNGALGTATCVPILAKRIVPLQCACDVVNENPCSSDVCGSSVSLGYAEEWVCLWA